MKSFIIFLFLAAPVLAQEPDSSSAIFQMREAESNFARASIMYGRNAAFIKNLADDCVVFTDSWITNGKQYSMERKASAFVLKWEPEYMDISESRDFGISTGPWEVQEYRPNTLPLSTGYFLTVWKKSSAGVWQVILDEGCSTPHKTSGDHKFSFPAGADRPIPNPMKTNIKSVSNELIAREEQILALWQKDPVPATYTSFTAANVRFQQNGHLPSTNADTIRLWIAQTDKRIIWKSSGSGVAPSGDMGYTYGVLEIKADRPVSKGHYVRIWRKGKDGIWYIVLEMMNRG